jgi:glucose-1-phosphate cytidylyltransferase
MKAVILAGGLGTRLSEETSVRPKPMVEIGGLPILWHIMKIYSAHGINDFIICCGHKGYMIKEFFANYFLRMSDVTFDMRYNQTSIHGAKAEPWRVTLADTGEATLTAGRLRRVREYIGNETFCFTYGDGVSNVNLTELIKFHKSEQTLVTLTAVQPPGRFGVIKLSQAQTRIESFQEKPEGDGAYINGGFFVLEPAAIEYISSETADATMWEHAPLQQIAHDGQLSAFRHNGFWQPMDTLRDKNYLETLWQSGEAPWKVW